MQALPPLTPTRAVAAAGNLGPSFHIDQPYLSKWGRMHASEIEQVLRLAAATVCGIAVGFNRELRGKPLGMRTLALVALGSAIAALSALDYGGVAQSPETLARILQGILSGVLTGIGFIGAGVVLRDRSAGTVYGLTTAATVWVTAALGIACALADWALVVSGLILTLAVLFVLGWLEKRLMS
jgi:putative Mg2+ transporter-C (MgtC) family protein